MKIKLGKGNLVIRFEKEEIFSYEEIPSTVNIVDYVPRKAAKKFLKNFKEVFGWEKY